MNFIERKVYDIVKKNPYVKNFIRDIYQGLFALFPKKKKDTCYEIIEREGYFFGFHDKIPWSLDNSMLLAHKFASDTKIGENIEIGYFIGDEYKKFKKIANTSSWNWQQGSMLQWINNNYIIFNDWNGEKNIARIFDKDGKKIKDLAAPIGAVSPDGKWGLTYSFERLNIGMPGYGYFNENDPYKYDFIPKNSGLSIIELSTGAINKLFSINDIAKIDPVPSMKDAYHFFTHCLFAPNDKRFLFLHRWYKKGERLYSRMISCDLTGDNIHIFPTKNMVSHITWINEKEVIAYCNTEDYGDGYHIFEDRSVNYRRIAEKHYSSDGHPQYNKVNNKIVTDTYPNRFRIQELSIYDPVTDKKEIIAKLWSPNYFKDELRCDLHPRWNRDGTMLCFDSAHTGKRALCTVKLFN